MALREVGAKSYLDDIKLLILFLSENVVSHGDLRQPLGSNGRVPVEVMEGRL